MKAAALTASRSNKTYLTLIFLSAMLVMLPQIARAQQNSLSLADILIGLRSKKAPISEKNQLLTDAVKTRGVTFELTEEIEKELHTTGANTELMAAIRSKSVIVKTAAPAEISPPAPKSAAPDSAFYQNQANAYFVKGDYNSAVINYNKAIELNPKDATAYLSRGLTYYNTRFYDLAIADYDQAVKLSPKDSTVYFKRGDAFEKMGNVEKAIADYEKSVELDAANEVAKNYLKRLRAEQEKNSPPKTQAAEAVRETPANLNPSAASRAVNIGSLNDLASKLAVPYYPPIERQRNVFGLVTVQISLDEEGKVLSAKALDGPRSLRVFAEEAAEKSKFKPALIDGKPAKVNGFITYNFKLR